MRIIEKLKFCALALAALGVVFPQAGLLAASATTRQAVADVADALVEAIGRVPAMLRCAIPQGFYSLYGSQDSALEHFSLQPEGLATRIAARLEGGQP